MGEKSTIPFMTTLAVFLILWNSYSCPSISPSVAFAIVSALLER
jgi:uncharacterized membrane protein YfbV (UPF0208 family)